MKDTGICGRELVRCRNVKRRGVCGKEEFVTAFISGGGFFHGRKR
jgi:hypothetical protein